MGNKPEKRKLVSSNRDSSPGQLWFAGATITHDRLTGAQIDGCLIGRDAWRQSGCIGSGTPVSQFEGMLQHDGIFGVSRKEEQL